MCARMHSRLKKILNLNEFSARFAPESARALAHHVLAFALIQRKSMNKRRPQVHIVYDFTTPLSIVVIAAHKCTVSIGSVGTLGLEVTMENSSTTSRSEP